MRRLVVVEPLNRPPSFKGAPLQYQWKLRGVVPIAETVSEALLEIRSVRPTGCREMAAGTKGVKVAAVLETEPKALVATSR